MVQSNQSSILQNRNGRAVVGREAILHVFVQIQLPQSTAMGGGLQEGEYVFP
jgi:hypothetical protein